MADLRDYTLNWSEIVDKTGTGTVDMDEVRLWLAGDDETQVDPTHVPTDKQVQEFLEAGDINDVIQELDDVETLDTSLNEVDGVVLT